jgi:O-antigen ligase
VIGQKEDYREQAWIKTVSRLILHTVLLAYPATMFVYDGLRSDYFGLLVILSIVLALAGYLDFSSLWRSPLVFYSLLLLASMGILAWVSYAYFGFPEYAKNRVANYSWFLFLPIVYLMVRQLKPDKRVVITGIILGCIIALIRALLEEWQLVDELAWGHIKGRANGVMHPIRFGDLVLLMAFIALAGALFLERLPRFLRILGVLAFFSGIFACILSLSRGAWLAAPFYLMVLYLGWRRQGARFNARLSWLIAGVMVFAIVAAPFVQKNMHRFGKVFNEVEMYMDGQPNTSSGARLSMMQTALAAIAESPVFGVGVGGYSIFAKEFYGRNQGRLSSEVAIWKNPHNEFLLQAASRGVVGLVLYCSAMFALLVLYRRIMKHCSVFDGAAGMILVTGYLAYGMTIALFEHRDFLLFFAVYVPVFMAEDA